MPKKNGNEIAAYVQNDKELKHIKIVFLTAVLNAEEIGIKADIAARSVVISKPAIFDRLIECIEGQLN